MIKVEGWEKIDYTNPSKNKSSVSIPVSNKTLRQEALLELKKYHNGSIQQEDNKSQICIYSMT